MIREGKGQVAPPIYTVLLDEKEVININILAKIIAKDKGYNTISTMIGFYGESATAKYLNSFGLNAPCDFRLKGNGDGGIDIIASNLSIQIKTRYNGAFCKVKRTRKRKLLPLVCDVFVFCKLRTAPNQNIQIVDLVGWIEKEELEASGKIENHYGNYFNIIDEKYLLPMNRLARMIQNDIALR